MILDMLSASFMLIAPLANSFIAVDCMLFRAFFFCVLVLYILSRCGYECFIILHNLDSTIRKERLNVSSIGVNHVGNANGTLDVSLT